MKKIYLLPLMVVVAGCSGIAPEAVRDDSNTLVRPSFMNTKVLDVVDQQQPLLDAVSEK